MSNYSMTSLQKVSIVIPVFCAEQSIESLVNDLISEIVPLYDLEIVLVNDGSLDNSEQVCIQLFEQFPKIVKFFSLSKNVGEHNAVMAGLNQTAGEYVVIMDDDFQNPIQELEGVNSAEVSDFRRAFG